MANLTSETGYLASLAEFSDPIPQEKKAIHDDTCPAIHRSSEIAWLLSPALWHLLHLPDLRQIAIAHQRQLPEAIVEIFGGESWGCNGTNIKYWLVVGG